MMLKLRIREISTDNFEKLCSFEEVWRRLAEASIAVSTSQKAAALTSASIHFLLSRQAVNGMSHLGA